MASAEKLEAPKDYAPVWPYYSFFAVCMGVFHLALAGIGTWMVVMAHEGPRPEVEPVVQRYDAHHRRRLKAKPGVTGLQQVEARATTELDERVRLDVYYIRRRSFLFDLWIVFRTPWAVVHGRGAT